MTSRVCPKCGCEKVIELPHAMVECVQCKFVHRVTQRKHRVRINLGGR